MRKVSRNRLMALNTAIVLITTILNVSLGMYEIRLLIARYGSAVNGLMQTGNQLMSYVALLEAGIGASYVYSLYKPLAENDQATISALYMGYKISLRKAVLKMLLFALIASFVYPFFLKNNGISYWFMVSVLALQSTRKIVPYLLTLVPQNMIIAKERRYIANIIGGGCSAITYLVEIVILRFTKLPVQFILIVCVAVAVSSGVLYEIVMRKMYKGILNYNALPDRTPQKMSKDVFASNISAMVFNSTDNVIISVLGSLSSVTLYTNYSMISNQVSNLVSSTINGTSASIGLKLAGKDGNTYNVFREIWTGTLFAGGIITAVFIVMINDFIALWVGSEFCLSLMNVMLFAYIMYANIISPVLYIMTSAAGLYKESRNFKIFQSVLNLVITIILVPIIGITGALLGTLLARVAVTIPQNCKLIYKNIFGKGKTKYVELIIAAVMAGLAAVCGHYITSLVTIQGINGFEDFLVKSAIATLIALTINGVYWFFASRDFRCLISRVTGMVFRKKRKS